MESRIVVYKNHEDDFFEKMGEFFAFRKYAHEMGGWQFYTKDGSIWIVLFVNNKVAGFCSIIQEKNHLYFDNFFMLKEFRGLGLSSELFKKRLDIALSMNQEIRVITDNPIQMKRYSKFGFEHYGNRGRYNKYRLCKK